MGRHRTTKLEILQIDSKGTICYFAQGKLCVEKTYMYTCILIDISIVTQTWQSWFCFLHLQIKVGRQVVWAKRMSSGTCFPLKGISRKDWPPRLDFLMHLMHQLYLSFHLETQCGLQRRRPSVKGVIHINIFECFLFNGEGKLSEI